MALVSPGVQVSIIDESQYLPSAVNSVPLIVLATAQNKANASNTGVAQATTSANANKLYLVTSQRDLVNLYGTPFFYTTTDGTPIQGYELNEYGLLAAYSTLGITNRCYVLRADIDLASLVGKVGRPNGAPADGTYWLDTTNTTWGIYEFNASTGKFNLKTPLIVSDAAYLNNGTPIDSLGNIGDYAVVPNEITTSPGNVYKTYFYKTTKNNWVSLGSPGWKKDVPTVIAENSNPTLTAGDTFNIDFSGLFTINIVVPVSPNNTANGVATQINNLGYNTISAEVRNGKLCIFSNQLSTTMVPYLSFSAGTGTVLTDLGINSQSYYQVTTAYGTSSQMPLWSASQSTPRPTGSVWLKMGSAGNGFSPVISKYSKATSSWVTKVVSLYTSDEAANANLDSTGGQAIPQGTLYAQYGYDRQTISAPIYIWERIATGPTIVTGTVTNPQFSSGPYYMNVYVSVPGSNTLSGPYNFSLANNTAGVDFVTAWSAAGIPFTTCSLTNDGAIQLSHTEGGEIVLSDTVNSAFIQNGSSNGLIVAAGFVVGTTSGVKYGPYTTTTYVVSQNSTTGVGSNATFSINNQAGAYILNGTGVLAGGSGYQLGDLITINGTSLGGTSPANDLVLSVTAVNTGAVTAVTTVTGTPSISFETQLSNWVQLDYIANEGAPVAAPANNTNWFYSVVDQVDIMVQKNNQWIGYKNTSYDQNGAPAATGVNATDPNGPIVSDTEPTTQSDGTALVYGDLWVSTADLENYPIISRWQNVNGVDQWVLINNADQVSSEGVLFADARWAGSGDVNPSNDPIPTITSLLSSNYLDLDAPSASLYPQGMLLWNTRRSGYNIKEYRVNYFNSNNFPDQVLPAQTDAWVSVSGHMSNGAAYMGRKAQRAMVVKALRSAIDTNTDIRDEDNFFNLVAAPNYPELQPNMVVLDSDRGETCYIIGDTPLGLTDQATAIQAWANNTANATSTGEDGLVTRNVNLGIFYPSGITNDLNGNQVVVPASHMMLRTFLYNDQVAYPWFAPAGTRRGIIDNALNIGYLDRETGEFQVIKTSQGIRDVLYTNQINPLTFFTGVGLLNYGNKNSFDSQSALDRINVARLVNYLRRQLTIALRPFVFEQNDALTRSQVQALVQTLMIDLVAKRGLYDYLVVCDESNNTPDRIDRNELWVDVAIEPTKAAEFIYVPVRILNTGGIKALGNG